MFSVITAVVVRTVVPLCPSYCLYFPQQCSSVYVFFAFFILSVCHISSGRGTKCILFPYVSFWLCVWLFVCLFGCWACYIFIYVSLDTNVYISVLFFVSTFLSIFLFHAAGLLAGSFVLVLWQVWHCVVCAAYCIAPQHIWRVVLWPQRKIDGCYISRIIFRHEHWLGVLWISTGTKDGIMWRKHTPHPETCTTSTR